MSTLVTPVQSLATPVFGGVVYYFTDKHGRDLRSEERQDRREEADREDRRRMDDADREETRRAEEKSAALRERWRDERKASHTALLNGLQATLDGLRRSRTLAALVSNKEAGQSLDGAQVVFKECGAQLASVNLIGSDSSRRAAQDAYDKTRSAERLLRDSLRGTPCTDAERDEQEERDKQCGYAIRDASAALDAYLGEARTDLGTG